LAGNFIIDSLIVIACYFLFHPNKDLNWLSFYKGSIIKVWLFGFMADIIGVIILFGCIGFQEFLGLSNEVIKGISYDPFSNVLSTILLLMSMIISGLCIILFNYRFTFSNLIEEELPRWKVAAFIGITTLPWTFLLPTKWFY